MNNIDKIDYKTISSKLIDMLKADDKFKDVNFQASGIKTFINMLAYNTHYLGMYAYMLNNESSIDSAQLMESIYSKSRGLGYFPRHKRAARAEVIIKTNPMEFPEDGYTVFHRFKNIIGTSDRDNSTRFFSNPDDIYLYDYEKTNDGKFIFSSNPTVIMEGKSDIWNFVVDKSVEYQTFIIKDEKIDIDTIRVYVKESESDIGIAYKHADSVFDLTETSNIFYITTTHDGYYQIFFGNNVFGKQPEDGNIISCEYVSTNGEDGNGCSKFTFPGFTFVANEMSNSGSNGESLENIKFNAINHFRSQNRLSIKEDFRSMIMTHFRNIKAINVWGGEDHFQKMYGKIFISIKPVFADVLSNSAKKEIRNSILAKTEKLGADPILVDPEFIDCYVDIILTTNLNITNESLSDVKNAAISAVTEYNKNYLNIFNNKLIDLDLNNMIKKSSVAISGAFTRKTLFKKITIDNANTTEYTIYFGNKIIPSSVNSLLKIGRYNLKIVDNDGILVATDELETKVKFNIGSVDYNTGTIKFKNPIRNYTGHNELIWNCTPKNPDINSVLNNIVRITRTRVVDE